MRIATPAFFWFPFAWDIFFRPLTFSLYVSLGLKWVSCRQHIYRSCFCILLPLPTYCPLPTASTITIHTKQKLQVSLKLQNFPSLRMSAAIDFPVYARLPIIVKMYQSLYCWWHSVACMILVPRPGIKSMPPAVEAQSPIHWTAREFPPSTVKIIAW